jgi:hypothetical protein
MKGRGACGPRFAVMVFCGARSVDSFGKGVQCPIRIRAEQNSKSYDQRDLPIDPGGEHLGRITLRLCAADVL